MTYAPQHRSASALVARKGAGVTFTKRTTLTDASTGASTTSVTTVAGFAVRVRGNPKQYEALGLLELDAPTLLFAASTYGEVPELGGTCVWGGETYTVRAVDVVAPDATAILSRVVVSL